MSLVQLLPINSSSHTLCPQCGSSISHAQVAEEAQRRIVELEAQIRSLNAKAASAADKLADCEDELQTLRTKSQNQRPGTRASSNPVSQPPQDSHESSVQAPSAPAPSPAPASTPSLIPSLSSLLSSRRNAAASSSKPTLNPRPSPAPTGTSTHSMPTLPSTNTNTAIQHIGSPEAASETLTFMLQAETKARLEAETSLSQAHSELEELTAQLFGQANEMVANERKARAKLEERIEILEQRDGDKRRRLERLEKALGRIERVRGIVG